MKKKSRSYEKNPVQVFMTLFRVHKEKTWLKSVEAHTVVKVVQFFV